MVAGSASPADSPRPFRDGLDAPFWAGLRDERLVLQRCVTCRRVQWLPEWLCYRCHSFDLDWIDVRPTGSVYSWYRSWQPHDGAVPYRVVLIELDDVPGVRLLGTALGDPNQSIRIGSTATGVFRHLSDATLLDWQITPETDAVS